MVLLAHIADAHLGLVQYGSEERELDIYEAFDEAMSKSVEERVDAVLLAGDIFDRPRPSNTAISKFRAAVARALERGIPVLAVSGDHEIPRGREKRILDVLEELLPGLVVLKARPAEGGAIVPDCYELRARGGEVLVFGAPSFRRRLREKAYERLFESLESLLKSAERSRKKVLLGHLPVKELLPGYLEPGVSLSDFPERLDYVALGHVHARVVARAPKGPLVAYAGSTEILDKSEVRQWAESGKGFYLVDLSGDEPVLHKVDLSVRPQYELAGTLAEVEAELRRILALPSGPKKPVLHVVLRTTRELRDKERRKIEELAQGRALLVRVFTEVLEEGLAYVPLRDLDEARLVAKVLGVDVELASLLVGLKECLASSGDDPVAECSEYVERVLESEALRKLAQQRGYAGESAGALEAKTGQARSASATKPPGKLNAFFKSGAGSKPAGAP